MSKNKILTKSQHVAIFHKEGHRGSMIQRQVAEHLGVSRSLVAKYDIVMKRLAYSYCERILTLDKLCKGELEITQLYDRK